jgi:hypothetical protein
MFDELPIDVAIASLMVIATGVFFLTMGCKTAFSLVFNRPISPLAQAFVDFFENVKIGDVAQKYQNVYYCPSKQMFLSPLIKNISYGGAERFLSRKERKLVLRKMNEACSRILAQKLDGGKFDGSSVPDRALKVGDLVMVCPTKPTQVPSSIGWAKDMDKMLGKSYEVKSVAKIGEHETVKLDRWIFMKNWVA